MSDALSEYQEKVERIREIIPWATDALIGLILAEATAPNS
jgi:hypothetical protein